MHSMESIAKDHHQLGARLASQTNDNLSLGDGRLFEF